MDHDADASLMSVFLLDLAILAQLHFGFVAGSVLSVHKECLSGQIGSSWSADECEFFVGLNKVLDFVSLCQELESYLASGCLVCKSHAEEWERISKEHCDLDWTVFALEESDACPSGNSSPLLCSCIYIM